MYRTVLVSLVALMYLMMGSNSLIAQAQPKTYPKGWQGVMVKEFKITVWGPRGLGVKTDFGPLGDRVNLEMNREGKATAFVMVKPKKATDLDQPQREIAKKLESKDYIEVEIGGKKGICSFKDGMPVGNVKNYEFQSVSGPWHITFRSADPTITQQYAELIMTQVFPSLK